MNPDDRFAELWTDYLEGELDENGIDQLRALLAADADLVRTAADLYQTHRLLGLVADDTSMHRNAFVDGVIARLPEKSDQFVSDVMADVEQLSERRVQVEPKQPMTPAADGDSAVRDQRWMLALVASLLIAVIGFASWRSSPPEVATVVSEPTDASHQIRDVRFTSLAHAKFFGELLPPVDSALAPRRDYVLMSGLVELSFPAGASAIVEGPAVFRVLSEDSLALDVGSCSVHAPDGAEGFHVVTPVTRVVDRGTRFNVSVAETSETEVQVIEGAADIYEHGSQALSNADAAAQQRATQTEVRLTVGEASKFARGREFAADSIPYDPAAYHRQLPDRVISYQANVDEEGGSTTLTSVTIQRGGRTETILVGDIIPAQITAFTTTLPGAFICGDSTYPVELLETASNRSLNAGVINPGGSEEPLSADPVLLGESATPGMAIRFRQPVINGPGDDVVFFDLQTFGNPPDGDAFHISPVRFRPGLKSHTIRIYDLTMESPGSHELAGFYVHMFRERASSLETLRTLDTSPSRHGIRFRGLTVGIDLSDLGYGDGETVDELFIQDALDDKHIVDPVFIGGLPPLI
ncbi:FecR protein [Rubripirellula lacrimiformis]|uniref:FecR protein n=1 Tax=Rubripirellula lacrimiformis TaxID=1930273 RepID=A0A517NJ71_9BACT|nr:FecR domain-containing protein [Rubripirellula lacrimiformis]QDT07083.1 FecR protein [Rubripirellula lacrimiformis]